MSDSTHSVSWSKRIKVGIFSACGIVLIVGVTIAVNDKPFWWRPCQLVNITVEDASGLKVRSPVKSRGLQVGYLHSIDLTEKDVRLGICLTADVEVVPETRAYLKGEGFLGDKYVDLRPLKYNGKPSVIKSSLDWILPVAYAEEPPTSQVQATSKEIPVGSGTQDVQVLVNRVDSLVGELTKLTGNLKEGINPGELRKTMVQLNRALESASKTLSPEGGLTTTAQRALSKLEDSIEQLRDLMTKINQGKGSVGMLLNDPSYADEIREAIRNVNKLLSRVGSMRLVVDMGVEQLPAYTDGRGWFRLGIYPTPDRYYLVGLSVDPRGKVSASTTTTTTGSLTTTTSTTQVEKSGVLITAMLGKILLNRFELAAGVLHGDATARLGLRLGGAEEEERLQIQSEVYTHTNNASSGAEVNARVNLQMAPFGGPYLKTVYFRGGIDSITKVNDKLSWNGGVGLMFDDNDIKILFSLR